MAVPNTKPPVMARILLEKTDAANLQATSVSLVQVDDWLEVSPSTLL